MTAVRITQTVAEVVRTGTPAAVVTQVAAEIVRQSGAPVNGNAGQIAVETLRGALVPTAYAGQIAVETLRGGLEPRAYVGQIAVEVLHSSMAGSTPAAGPPRGSMFMLY